MASVRLSKLVDEEAEARINLNNEDRVQKEDAPLQIKDEEDENGIVTSKKIDWNYYLRYISLIVLVVQNTSQVLLMRYATTRSGPQFLTTVAVCFSEVTKFITAMILFTVSVGSIRKTLSALHHHFIVNPLDTVKVGVPAFIYTLQNFLLFVALANLDAATYMVTYQLKILTTALFTVLMLKRHLSIVQWGSLLILIAGVILVQISAGKSVPTVSANLTDIDFATTLSPTTLAPTTLAPTDLPLNSTSIPEGPAVQRPWIGLTAVLTACVMSGFAGIYLEKILKGSDVSIWMRNIQLAAWSIIISTIMMMGKDHDKILNNSLNEGLLRGFDLVVCGVVALTAFGGLVVAVVVKYADNILKAFATSIAIIVSSVASILLFSLYPTPLFMAGATLVIGSVVLYSVFPYKKVESLNPA